MAKAWDIEPSIFAGMIEEDVGLKIQLHRYADSYCY